MTKACANCAEMGFRVAAMRAQVIAVAARIAAELEEPTMSRRDLLQQVQHQLHGVADTAGGL